MVLDDDSVGNFFGNHGSSVEYDKGSLSTINLEHVKVREDSEKHTNEELEGLHEVHEGFGCDSEHGVTFRSVCISL